MDLSEGFWLYSSDRRAGYCQQLVGWDRRGTRMCFRTDGLTTVVHFGSLYDLCRRHAAAKERKNDGSRR